ncbi:MAG TPA: O-acetyl-ADP-ribose deacetylase [Isosphaeraceae bacterium]|nr:O-acetyl-ADP-ribose deacetylase [Isosphaeraceae bacterium]
MQLSLSGGKVIELVQGDITREATDAIVNAANSSLLGGGGVDGAIHRAGGPAILEECKAIRADRGSLPPGQAVATIGGRLPARYVIHTVGPIWAGGGRGEADTLASCYRESLRIADELKLASITFPSISTGAFGYPVREAATVAIDAVKQALPVCQTIVTVRFVLFDERTLKAYAEAR